MKKINLKNILKKTFNKNKKKSKKLKIKKKPVAKSLKINPLFDALLNSVTKRSSVNIFLLPILFFILPSLQLTACLKHASVSGNVFVALHILCGNVT